MWVDSARLMLLNTRASGYSPIASVYTSRASFSSWTMNTSCASTSGLISAPGTAAGMSSACASRCVPWP